MQKIERLTRLEIYKQHYAYVIHLNTVFNQRPTFVATVVGGLWFIGAQFVGKDHTLASTCFAFAGCVAVFSLGTFYKMAHTIHAYLDKIKEAEGYAAVDFPGPKWFHSSQTVYAMFSVAAVLSFGASAYAWNELDSKVIAPAVNVYLNGTPYPSDPKPAMPKLHIQKSYP